MTEHLHIHFSLSCIGEGNGNPLQCSCLENPRDWGAWWAAVYGVAQSRTRLKRLSSSRRWKRKDERERTGIEGPGRRFETTEKPSLDVSRSLQSQRTTLPPKTNPSLDCIEKMTPDTQRNENMHAQNNIMLTVQTQK